MGFASKLISLHRIFLDVEKEFHGNNRKSSKNDILSKE